MPTDRQKPTADRTPSALQRFDSLPDDALARAATVCAVFDVSAPTVWRWTKTGRLPAPTRIGGITGWRVGDLRRILAGNTPTTV